MEYNKHVLLGHPFLATVYPLRGRGGCVQSTIVKTKNFCVLHNTVKHNYISSSSSVGIQLHVSALYVGHLQVVI